jgi:uncharacterized protein YukE
MPILHMQPEAVRQTGRLLQQTAQNLGEQSQRLIQTVHFLSGQWQGPSSDLFAGDMQPLLRTLQEVAQAGEELHLRLQREVEEWVQVDSSFGDSAATAGNDTTTGITTGEYNLSQEALEAIEADKPVYRLDPDALLDFNPSYAGSDELSQAMYNLSNHLANNSNLSPTDIDSVSSYLQQIADATGQEYDDVVQDYVQFRHLMGDSVPKITEEEFYGDIRQLRFGMIVGDSLGVHPVFGALLSPTGGMVGPSDDTPWLDNTLSPWDVMQYHGPAHDAAGFLQNYDIGDGYNYAPSLLAQLSESTFDWATKTQPFQDQIPALDGQTAGITYWQIKLQQRWLGETTGKIIGNFL